MLTLINTNRMTPPIAPLGLDYLAGAMRQAGNEVELVDLNLAEDSEAALDDHFGRCQPDLVGLSFRNADDCFWPSGESFVPVLQRDIAAVRRHTDAPIVLGGVGYSIFPQALLAATGADFGIRGDGEDATGRLLHEIRGQRRWDRVPGLIYRQDGVLRANPPAWPSPLRVPTARDGVDNQTYFRRGGQLGVETKRGCPRQCSYCADPLAKGRTHRLREPAEVAEEVAALADRGLDVLHLCDAEFNLPLDHALAVCDALLARRLGERVRWYAYLAVVPFPGELAERMRRAGCEGINFTGDSTHPRMLATYRQPHCREDVAQAVRNCRRHGLAVMLDLLLGGPGETPETATETVASVQRMAPDCAGAALGIRLYPGTRMETLVAEEGPLESNPGVYRHNAGPIDLLQPTFYISPSLGERPARLIGELIGDDPRFFPPEEATHDGETSEARDHNYNANQALVDAIAAGARGAYWDILRKRRTGNLA
ncbi:MAG: radical SAM protein [Candidatus Anammoximicrobium sp.]|nr:radical SAM protein [Candidatus Anammoximicrobium sp.]